MSLDLTMFELEKSNSILIVLQVLLSPKEVELGHLHVLILNTGSLMSLEAIYGGGQLNPQK